MVDFGLIARFTGVFLLLVSPIAILHVICCISYFKILKLLGYDKPWLAFVPTLVYKALAEATGYEEVELGFNIKLPMSVFKWWPFVTVLVGCIPVAGGIASIVFYVLCLGWTYRAVYSIISGKTMIREAFLAYLSCFFGIIPVVRFYITKADKIQYFYEGDYDEGDNWQ